MRFTRTGRELPKLKQLAKCRTGNVLTKTMAKAYIQGYYGCSCHPYKNWDELKYYEKQKLSIGERVKERCTSRIGLIYSLPDNGSRFYGIKYGELPRDNETIHVQNAIRVNDNGREIGKRNR